MEPKSAAPHASPPLDLTKPMSSVNFFQQPIYCLYFDVMYLMLFFAQQKFYNNSYFYATPSRTVNHLSII